MCSFCTGKANCTHLEDGKILCVDKIIACILRLATQDPHAKVTGLVHSEV